MSLLQDLGNQYRKLRQQKKDWHKLVMDNVDEYDNVGGSADSVKNARDGHARLYFKVSSGEFALRLFDNPSRSSEWTDQVGCGQDNDPNSDEVISVLKKVKAVWENALDK